MGGLSIWHLLILLAVVLVLFGGRGKISSLMGDFGKGIKSFKEGVGEGEKKPQEDASMAAPGALNAPHPASMQAPAPEPGKTTSSQG